MRPTRFQAFRLDRERSLPGLPSACLPFGVKGQMRRPDPIGLEETLPLFPLVLPMGYVIVKRLLALVLAAWIPPMRSRPANAAHENLARDVGESEKARQISTAEMNQGMWRSLQAGAYTRRLSVADGPRSASDASTLRLFQGRSELLSPCDGCLPSS